MDLNFKIFAISDLHLSFSTPSKSMEIFGSIWKNYQERIKDNWLKKISENDLVLIPGDISWAMKLKDALIDLEWLHNLPGKKIIIKGNHDYWWTSISKLRQALPPSISAIQYDSINIDGISIGGTRLWDTKDYNFDKFVNYTPNPNKNKDLDFLIQKDLSENIFNKELERLKMSLEKMDKNAKLKIFLTHYPPISAEMTPSKASKLLKSSNIDICVFGHLHNLNTKNLYVNNTKLKYFLTSSDYIDFDPIQII